MEKSELHFQRYCTERGYSCDRILQALELGMRSPDFTVVTKTQTVIVEVKELTANPDEIQDWRKIRSREIVLLAREPGKRARRHIREAIGQLRPYADNGLACVVVLYDNIFVDGTRPNPPIDLFGPIGPYDINVALYGLQTANVRLHPDGTTQSLGDGRSSKKKLHDRECLSAISVLYERPDNGNLFLCTYHNFFASMNLAKGVFSGPHDRHLISPAHPDQCPGQWIPMEDEIQA